MAVPSLKSVANIAGKYRSGAWLASKTLYPYPVYEARFADGTVARTSFWNDASKAWDFARPRNMLAKRFDKEIVEGFVEYDNPDEDWVRVSDPLTKVVRLKTKRGPSATDLKKLLASVLNGDGAAIATATELLAA